MSTTEGHLIACCCNDCLDRQVADIYDTFGDDAGLKQRLENERFIRKKAAFWDAFMERWQTPHDMTPMEDARAMVTDVAKLVARYDAGELPGQDGKPFITMSIGFKDPAAPGPDVGRPADRRKLILEGLRLLHEQAVAAAGEPIKRKIAREGGALMGAIAETRALNLHAEKIARLLAALEQPVACTCACHPENR